MACVEGDPVPTTSLDPVDLWVFGDTEDFDFEIFPGKFSQKERWMQGLRWIVRCGARGRAGCRL